MPVDDATKEALLRMQFQAQTVSYRTQFPDASFDILERDDIPFGRLITHRHAGIATFVDFALLPDSQGSGIGTAIITRILEHTAEQCPVVRLSVLWNNQASLRLTRRVGFVQAGESPPYLHMEWRGSDHATTTRPSASERVGS